MAEAGMAVRVDAAGNLVGRREGVRPDLPCLMLGSHLDSVRNAGRYDGMLGVLTAIECVEALGERALPFAIEVIGFGDEEGVRFQATMLGSRALAGTFDPTLLDLRDAGGTTLREAMTAFGLDPAALAGR
jgi:allantoate deiminase